MARFALEVEDVLEDTQEAHRPELNAEFLAQLASQRLLAALAEVHSAPERPLEVDAGDLVPTVRDQDLLRPRPAQHRQGNDARPAFRHATIMADPPRPHRLTGIIPVS